MFNVFLSHYHYYRGGKFICDGAVMPMMTYVGEWITHIVLIILIASFIDLLLPNSTMRRYVKLVVGLLIIMFILSPILDLFRFDYERLIHQAEEGLQEQRESASPQVEAELTQVEQIQEEAILDE